MSEKRSIRTYFNEKGGLFIQVSSNPKSIGLIALAALITYPINPIASAAVSSWPTVGCGIGYALLLASKIGAPKP